MMSNVRARFVEAALGLMVLGLPLLGAALGGRDLKQVFEFPPPLEVPTGYLAFAWPAAIAVLGCVGIVVVPWLVRLRRGPVLRRRSPDCNVKGRRFPVWGTLAIIWTFVWWVLAWTRWSWFEPGQRYTFFPLWIGFIVSVNAATEARSGTCLMRRAPGRWLALFAVSAVCWWVFEWLNRFVRNWHYLGVQDFGPAGYAPHASLCFSTVLPAIAAVAEWVSSHASWNTRTASGPRWAWLERRSTGLGLLIGGTAALVGTGVFPELFYPALWVAPLAYFLAAPVLIKRDGLPHEIARGDWSRAATWMIAALVCGFFWELWNWQSFAKWVYTVPGVERWHVFEMPLLGYAGYLPFGLECLLVTERVIANKWRSNIAGQECGPTP